MPVIPGRAQREPEIHTPQHRGYGFRARAFHARPGMTQRGRVACSSQRCVAGSTSGEIASHTRA